MYQESNVYGCRKTVCPCYDILPSVLLCHNLVTGRRHCSDTTPVCINKPLRYWKPNNYHHCNSIKKYNLLSFDNYLCLIDGCPMYKIIHDLAPPSLKQFALSCKDNGRPTRAFTRIDCTVQFGSTNFGQSTYSLQAYQASGVQYWLR